MEINIEEYMEQIIYWGLRVIGALIILIVGWIVGSWVRNRIQNVKKLDKTIASFLGNLAKYIILAVSLVAVLGQFGVQTASLLAVMGAAGLAIGLALQGTLSNVAAGTMLLILRPFGVGDYVEFGSTGGTVTALGLFGTELITVDNKYVFAPNSTVWGNEITNYTRTNNADKTSRSAFHMAAISTRLSQQLKMSSIKKIVLYKRQVKSQLLL